MSDTVLVAETGRATGSAESRRLRREERIPGVVYGQGMEPISVSVARRDLRIALSGSAGTNTVLDLTVDGKVYPAIVKEIQRHPVRRTVQHVDFIQLNLSEELTVSVPVRIEGEAKDVADNNGFVDLVMNELDVTCTPRNIPDEIVIDITDMTMDTTITVGDLDLPSGVSTSVDADLPVVTVLVTRSEQADEAAQGDAAEGDAAEGDAAEGDAAEGSDDAGDDAGE